ncbi:Uncharacterized protein APZ42_032400, partial [Daphnia magna]
VTVLEEQNVYSAVKFPVVPLGQICRLAEKSVVDFTDYINKVVGPFALKDGSLFKKELFIFDASLCKGQNAIVTLWNDDTSLVDGLDVTKHYYKVCVLDGRTNLFSQIPSISISAGSIINIAKVEIDSADAGIISAWKKQKLTEKRSLAVNSASATKRRHEDDADVTDGKKDRAA